MIIQNRQNQYIVSVLYISAKLNTTYYVYPYPTPRNIYLIYHANTEKIFTFLTPLTEFLPIIYTIQSIYNSH
jgi:hypothetical protein